MIQEDDHYHYSLSEIKEKFQENFDTFAAPNPDFQIGVKSAAQYQP